MKDAARILIVAGEISGDMQAARLVAALRALRPGLSFSGIGGEELRAQGVELFYHVRDVAVMGLAEVLRRFAFFWRVYHDMVRRAAAQRPDAVILVDYPGFNLRFAGECRRLGLKTIYFICPQVWAWNRARIPKMARSINQLISIFPFEARHFQDTGLAVEYVGHPLVDDALAALRAPATELPWGGTPRVALLPGSREQEVGRMLPLFLAAAARLERERPGAGFLLAAASPEIAAVLERETLRCRARPARCGIVTGQTREALRQADGALVASGTATVETALMGCPMVVAYRVAPLTYALGRLLVKTEHIGMVNIIAGRRICPEFIQHEATPQALAAALLPLLLDGPARDAMRADLRAVAQALGPGGAAGRAARAVLASLDA